MTLATRRDCLSFSSDIFDTLSDVSTDDSDIQITHESNTVISIDSDSESVTGHVHDSDNIDGAHSDDHNDASGIKTDDTGRQSIDYLMLPADCVVTRDIDYVTLDTGHASRLSADVSSSSSCCSDSSSDSSDHDMVIHLDDEVSFLVDGATAVDLQGSTRQG